MNWKRRGVQMNEEKKLKVLVIDIESTGKDLTDMLGELCEVQFLQETDEGLEAYKNSCKENKKFDLIFCNLTMPRQNGLDFLKKAKEIDKNVLVYICSVFPYKSIEGATEQFGGAGIILKPYEKEKIVAILTSTKTGK